MAKRKPKPSDSHRQTEDEKLIRSIQKWASKAITGDQHNRDQVSTSKRFLNGEHWLASDKAMRVNRPCPVIDRINPAIDQAVGDQRQNMPSLKVRPVDSGANAEWAQIKEGKIRHITSQLSARIALNKASEHQFQGGIGYIRVMTEYADDDLTGRPFEQKISVVPIYNELSVLWDTGSQQWDRMDSTRMLIYAKMSKSDYIDEYGHEPTTLEVQGDSSFLWRDEDAVVVAEYYVKEFSPKTIYALKTGEGTEDGGLPDEMYDLDPSTDKPKSRIVNSYKIYCYKVDGAEILDKKLWPSKYWPIVPVWGKEINVDGKTYVRGITKFAMEPNRMYDYYSAAAIEGFALTGKARTRVTPEMIKGHENQWNNRNLRMDPYELVNAVDPKNPGNIQWPQEVAPPQASAAVLQGLAQSADDIRTTTGRHLASLGGQGNEISGIAIHKRQTEGDVGDFAYTDNFNLAFCRVGEIILDLIPVILDTNRKIRTLAEDGINTKEIEINKPGNQAEAGDQPLSENSLFNDMKQGKYEVVVDTGPSYTTEREEAAEFYTAVFQSAPELRPIIGDLMMKNQDIAQSQLVSDRLKALMVHSGNAYLLPIEEIQALTKKFPFLQLKPQMNPALMAKIQESQSKALLNKMNAMKSGVQADNLKQEHIIDILTTLQEAADKVVEQEQARIMQQQQTGQGQAPVNPQGGMM
ncbi:MAG: portal protein [Dehalococcoidia bacterium]